MVTLSLRKMSHPSVFLAAFFEVETAEIVMLRNVTSLPSFTYSRSMLHDRQNGIQLRTPRTKLIHSGPLIILMFCTVTFVAWKSVSKIGRTIESCFALTLYICSVKAYNMH